MYLSDYQTFNSKRELNEAISAHLADHMFNLSASAKAVLSVVSRYAVKFPGAAHLKAATIAGIAEVSEKTVRRALNKLAVLGVIKKVATLRKVNGGKGANIIVILPHDQSQVSSRTEAAEPCAASDKPSENTTEPFLSSKHKTFINTRDAEPSVDSLDYRYVSSGIPAEFTEAVRPFFSQASEIYRLWGRLKLAAKHSLISDQLPLHVEECVQTFREAIRIYKTTNVKADVFGYVYGAWRNKTAEIGRRVYADSKQGGWLTL